MTEISIEWTEELEKARMDLCHYWLQIADDPHEGKTRNWAMGRRAIETEQALTILGEIAKNAEKQRLQLVKWQPIETAPTDGSKVDLWITPPPGALTTGDYGRVSDCWCSEGRWWFYNDSKYASDPDNCRSEVWHVTHWMPRPGAPNCTLPDDLVKP